MLSLLYLSCFFLFFVLWVSSCSIVVNLIWSVIDFAVFFEINKFEFFSFNWSFGCFWDNLLLSSGSIKLSCNFSELLSKVLFTIER